MTVQATQLYDGANEILLEDATEQWDEAAADYMFILAKDTYTPSDAHTTVANVGTGDVHWIETGDGAPIAAGTRTVGFTGADTFMDSADADFGDPVTITAKYLICILSATGTVQSTDKLIFVNDLVTEGGNASSSAAAFKVTAPANGWFKYAQA